MQGRHLKKAFFCAKILFRPTVIWTLINWLRIRKVLKTFVWMALLIFHFIHHHWASTRLKASSRPFWFFWPSTPSPSSSLGSSSSRCLTSTCSRSELMWDLSHKSHPEIHLDCLTLHLPWNNTIDRNSQWLTLIRCTASNSASLAWSWLDSRLALSCTIFL